MSRNCCFDHEKLQYKSLIFNAGNMNDANTTGSDTEQIENSGLFIMGWQMPFQDADEYSLTFSVPRDAFSGCQDIKVFVHLISDNSSTPTGNNFSIRFSSLFTKSDGVISLANLNTVNRTNIHVQNSPAHQQYNHYVIEFDLNQIINPEDFALLSIARISAINDYTGPVAITSVEFRYLSC